MKTRTNNFEIEEIPTIRFFDQQNKGHFTDLASATGSADEDLLDDDDIDEKGNEFEDDEVGEENSEVEQGDEVEDVPVLDDEDLEENDLDEDEEDGIEWEPKK